MELIDSNLPPVWIRDAKTGVFVGRGQRVVIGRDPDDNENWWRWTEWKYRDGKAMLWVQTNDKPDGYWQECSSHFGGICWVFPS